MALTKRERCLLYILNHNGPISKLKLVKLMFLISKRLEKKGTPPYHFVPYKYGPFSFQMYHDLNRLERDGRVTQTDTHVEILEKKDNDINENIRNVMDEHLRRFGGWDDSHILKYVYSRFPEYGVYADIADKDHKKREGGAISIGYEGRSIDEFLYILITHGVDVVIDVRKNPFSMKFGFSKKVLKDHLSSFMIGYLHVPELGIDSSLRKHLAAREDYRRLFQTYRRQLDFKRDALTNIKEMSEKKKVALMCFERDVDYCHRGIIADKLTEWGVVVENL